MTGPDELPRTPPTARRLPPGSSTIVLALGGPITPADVPALCERVRLLLEGSDGDVVTCDTGALVAPDVATVDGLARMQLTARKLGCSIRLRNPCAELTELLALLGLYDVVGLSGATARTDRADRRAGTGWRCRGRS